nr:hypothetical protein [uncultured bacterium]
MENDRILKVISEEGENMAILYHNTGKNYGVATNEYFHSLIVVSRIYEKITGLDMFQVWLRMAREEE